MIIMNGSLLRKLRKSKNMTQAKLAELLDVELSTIGKWEIHNVTPSNTKLLEISKIFNVSIDELLNNASKDDINTIEEKLLLENFRKLDKSIQDDILQLVLHIKNNSL